MRRIEHRDRRLSIGLIAMVLAVGATLPAGASQHEGVIDATVTVVDAPEACILLSITALDFGTLDFGEVVLASEYSIEKCSTASQDLYVMGTDASLSDGVASWQLSDTPFAGLGLNEYAVTAWPVEGDLGRHLSSSAAQLFVSNMPASSGFLNQLEMPPVGSDGAGQVASFQIIWIAVLSG